CLLALMESADPRLIFPMDSQSGATYRLGGSRSDLSAITLFRTWRKLCGVPFLSSKWLIQRCAPPYAG
ncbi:MAG: hypothetical protein KDI64_11455, partial [Candidatus Accumulibacter sp.]|nr:hypothetical protein [Accumulibacter sp.]